MKFMVMVRATPDTEGETNPGDEDLLREMMAYNQQLLDAGVLAGGDGLQPSRKGARVVFTGDSRTVIDGPFAESKELIAGYWIFNCASLAECVDWVKRCPNPTGPDSVIEIRQIYEAEDFGEAMTPDLREQEERMRARLNG